MTTIESNETTYHRLLRRQIRKSLPADLAERPELLDFLASVNQAYLEFEDDLGRVEHILEQSSNELFKANRELRRIAEEKTEEAASTNHRLEEIVSSISEILFQLDRKGNIIYLNPAWEKVTGIPVADSLGKNWSSFSINLLTKDEINRFFDHEVEFVNDTVQFLSNSGDVVWLNLSLRRHRSIHNEHIGYIGTLVDITSRKKQEERINQLVEWLNESSEAVQVSDEEGTLVFVNREASNRLGLQPEELMGKHISFVEKIFEQRGMWDAHVDELRSRSKMIMEGVHKRHDGTSFPVEASVKYHESNGEGYVLAFIRDISERMDAERKLRSYMRDLERINAELDTFAYVVSHDLKAPLRAINNLSEWIEEDISHLLEGDTRDQFKLLRGRVLRMENLINGILSYSRAGRIKTNKESFVVKVAIDDLCDNFTNSKAEFTFEGAEDLTIFSEKITLEQILVNLISNGIKYNNKPAIKITVGWKELDSSIEFFVRDNGPGIPPEFQQKIFVIFQTLQSRDEIESTGVGLAIVKKIIDEKGCEIRIESAPDEGTTFFFTWPKYEKPESEE